MNAADIDDARADEYRDRVAHMADIAPHRADTISDPQGGRNMIRRGDRVRVAPSAPGKRDGFDAEFRGAQCDETGRVVWVDVYGGPPNHEKYRSVPASRLKRRRQTKGGEQL